MKNTINYEIFKKQPSNRDLVEVNVKKLMHSIKGENLLEYRPIIVDKDMNILDGQHRLEAAKRLKIPIWYEIKTDGRPEDIYYLNVQRAWYLEDYLNYYANSGKDEYLKLKKFMTSHGFRLAMALGFCNNKTGGDEGRVFKSGQYKFPDNGKLKEILENVGKYRLFHDYICEKTPGNHSYIKLPSFIRAFAAFINIKAVDFDLFMGRLPYKLDLMHPCSKMGDYLRILKIIYNFRSRDPLPLDDDMDKIL